MSSREVARGEKEGEGKEGKSVSLSSCEVAQDEVAEGEGKREGEGMSSRRTHSLLLLCSVGR